MNKDFFMENKKIIILGIIILLLLISNFTSSWGVNRKSQSVYNNSITGEIVDGLWNKCEYTNIKGPNNSSATKCFSISNENMTTSFKITRACVILSLLLMMTGVTLFYIKPEYKFNYVLFICAGILSIIGSISWNSHLTSGDSSSNDFKFGYSWYFNLLAGMAVIVTGVMIEQNKL